MTMMKGQDILVLLKLITSPDDRPSFGRLAADLSMSPAEVHKAVTRLARSGLIQVSHAAPGAFRKTPHRQAVMEFMAHGLKYVFPAERGSETRGMPTMLSAPGLEGLLVGRQASAAVWPDPKGETRGILFRPISRSAPAAARKDRRLYTLLALADVLRGGSAREKSVATDALAKMIQS